MSTGAALITLVRDQVGFPTPVTGGDDFLKDTNILKWINAGFKKMTEKVNGIPVYIEFTITDAAVITITNSTSSPAVGALTKVTEDYDYYRIPAMQSFGLFRNLSPSVVDSSLSSMRQMFKGDYRFQQTYNDSTDFYYWYYTGGEKGFVLLPKTITETNIIGINYRQEQVDLAVGDSPNAYFEEEDQQIAVDYATYRSCKQLEMFDKAREYRADFYVDLRQFVQEKRDRNAGDALSLANPWGNNIIIR